MYLKYLWYVIRHKWFVFVECWKYGIVWQGIIHDWHKLLPSEFIPYARFFYGNVGESTRDETGYYKPTDTGYLPFDLAWLHHQKLGKHHWQYWILPEDEGGVKLLQMPEKYILELVADWKGAGKAQGTPNTIIWYEKNKDKMQLHPDTRERIELLLNDPPPKGK